MRGASALEAEGELFDDGVGEDLGGDAFDLLAGGGGVEAVGQREQKVLTLADVGDASVGHAAESVGDRLALCIEHGGFECDIDMSLHRDRL